MKLRYLIFLWELPQLFLGFLFFIFLFHKIKSRLYYKDAFVIFVKGFPGGISLSWIIFLDEKYLQNKNAVRHEYGHTIQSLYLGWFYLFIVGVPSITRAFIWRKFKLESKKYYSGFPESWANKLGKVAIM